MSDKITNNITLDLNDDGKGAFYFENNGERIGEMVISTDKSNLTVYHTEVSPEMEGKGIARSMVDTMTDYARDHHLKVVPLCPYVHAQFKRHPELYNDIWKKD